MVEIDASVISSKHFLKNRPVHQIRPMQEAPTCIVLSMTKKVVFDIFSSTLIPTMLQVTSSASTTTPPDSSAAAAEAAVKETEAAAGERTRSLAGGRETGRGKVRDKALAAVFGLLFT